MNFRNASNSTNAFPNALWEKKIEAFCRSHGIPTPFPPRLTRALTHSSWSHEQASRLPDNQRLEYLGDSVLGLVINRYLFETYPEYDEGQLSRIKSVVVAEDALFRVAKKLGIGELLLLGKGEKKAGGKDRPSNLADALEALIAALYLDLGLPFVEQFILTHFSEVLNSTKDPRQACDEKTSLQERMQKEGRGLPVYKVLSSTGPDHNKTFEVAVYLSGQEIARAKGSSIKKAERKAARMALSEIKNK